MAEPGSEELVSLRKFIEESKHVLKEEIKADHDGEADVAGAHKDSRDIMITVDESDNAKRAFDYAVANVLQGDGKDVCHLVHHFNIQTYPVGPPEFVPTALAAIKSEKEYRRKQGINLLKKFAKICHENKISWKAHILSGGEVRDAVLEYSKTLKPDMIVVGCRGHGTLKRALLGSLSSFMVHHAETPVLVVR